MLTILAELVEFYMFIFFGHTNVRRINLILMYFSQSQPNFNPIDLIAPIVGTLWPFIAIFFFCESGEMVTDQFDSYENEFHECNWYFLPLDVQQHLVIFISDLQQIKHIRGYANVLCTREYFKKVRPIAKNN